MHGEGSFRYIYNAGVVFDNKLAVFYKLSYSVRW